MKIKNISCYDSDLMFYNKYFNNILFSFLDVKMIHKWVVHWIQKLKTLFLYNDIYIYIYIYIYISLVWLCVFLVLPLLLLQRTFKRCSNCCDLIFYIQKVHYFSFNFSILADSLQDLLKTYHRHSQTRSMSITSFITNIKKNSFNVASL